MSKLALLSPVSSAGQMQDPVGTFRPACSRGYHPLSTAYGDARHYRAAERS
jgi:hypothetical protein